MNFYKKSPNLLAFSTIVFIASLLGSCKIPGSHSGESLLATNNSQQLSSAWEVWTTLERSVATQEDTPITTYNSQVPITFGAEKEGSSKKITRIFGPSDLGFKGYLFNHTDPTIFLRAFLKDWVNGSSRIDQVVDKNGVSISISPAIFSNTNFDEMNASNLQEAFLVWLEQTKMRPFSFLKQDYTSIPAWVEKPNMHNWKSLHIFKM